MGCTSPHRFLINEHFFKSMIYYICREDPATVLPLATGDQAPPHSAPFSASAHHKWQVCGLHPQRVCPAIRPWPWRYLGVLMINLKAMWRTWATSRKRSQRPLSGLNLDWEAGGSRGGGGEWRGGLTYHNIKSNHIHGSHDTWTAIRVGITAGSWVIETHQECPSFGLYMPNLT